MSQHIFASIVTHFGTAANNRAETEGNVTTLQKLVWKGQTHSSVSAESIRFALRRLLHTYESGGTNRRWNENARANEWQQPDFRGWSSKNGRIFIDDDLLGFMSAEAAKEEGETGKATVRRGVLEVTKAISLTPWPGDVTFNSASPGATPSAQKKGSNPVPYGTEVHATRYQFGVALTPERLRTHARAALALRGLCELGTVAGNHGRFLFDFSPDSVIFRVTDDPSPRLLYCFTSPDEGGSVDAPSLLERVEDGDIDPSELIIGGSFARTNTATTLKEKGAVLGANGKGGIKAALEEALRRVKGARG